MPETGRTVADNETGPASENKSASIEPLSADEYEELWGLIRCHDMMVSWTPEYAADLEAEALTLVPGIPEDFDVVREEL